jgi:hypothetical protein
MKNEKYTNHFNLAVPVSRLTKLSFCIASICFAYSYQSDIPMVKPSLDYLQNFERTKVYEDSLDIIDGNGTTYMDCSASIKRTEDRTISCGEDYTGSITQRRHIYGTGVIANGECRNTSDGKATNWTETSNTCVYTPVCTDEDSTVTKEECPRGYHGAITHTKTKRSIHFGKRVTPDTCTSEYQTTTQDSNTCDKDVNITDGGNKVTIPDGKGGKKIIDFSDEPIEESKVCNESYELNGEAGQWVTFKRGGPSFWLPMYEDYINKYGVKRLYAEIFNAEKNKSVKWMATTSKQGTKCIGLDNEFVNSQFADTATNYIDHKIESPTGLKWNMVIYKDVYHNYDVKNTVFKISDEDALKNKKRLTLNARRFNATYENIIEWDNDKRGRHFDSVFEAVNPYSLLWASDLFHLKADDVNIVSNNPIGLWVSKDFGNGITFKGNITSNTFNAPNVNLILGCEVKTETTTDRVRTNLFKDGIRNINIKKAVFNNWLECAEYSSLASLDSYVNIDDLTLSGEMRLFEKTHFNGNVHNATFLLSYGTINGDIDMVPAVGKTDGNYYLQFGEHNGTVRGNDESVLDLIPNEHCNNISYGGVTGNWYNFKGGGNAFQLPLYEDYINSKGKMALFDKAMNAFQRHRYAKAFIAQSDVSKNSSILADLGNFEWLINQDKNVCTVFADEYRNSANNDLIINDNTVSKSNFAVLLATNPINKFNNLTGDNFVIRMAGFNPNNKALGNSRQPVDISFNDITVKYSNKKFYEVHRSDRYSTQSSASLFMNRDNGLITFNNLKVSIPEGYDLPLNDRWTRRFNFNKIDGNLIVSGNKGWVGEFIGNEANIAKMIYDKYPKNDGGRHKIAVNKLIVRNDVVIPYASTFTGNITVKDGDIVNYGTINGTYCIQGENHYLNNFKTVNATNVCDENNGYDLIPDDYCNDSVVINGDSSGWYSFKRGSPAFYKPFVMDYINKYGAADFYNWLYNSEYTKTYYLKFGETEIERYHNKCLLMGNDFWDKNMRPNKDNKLDLVIKKTDINNTSHNKIIWNWNALDKNGKVGGAFEAYLNLDLKGVEWFGRGSDVSYKNHKLYSDTIKLRNGASLDVIRHYIDADKILSDSVKVGRYGTWTLTLFSGKVNYIDGLESINLVFERNINGENLLTVHNAEVNSFEAVGYSNAIDVKQAFNVDELKYKRRIEIDKNSTINGNVTNVFKNPDIHIKDYIYGTLNGNLKTNNEFYLYGTLNGDLWMRGGLSRKFDNFGTHNGQIHNYDDIGYKYD